MDERQQLAELRVCPSRPRVR
ncbi:protein of unknown function (plasmid) [Cupriavidus neocaledonicus]|uniref:Uncharacterized protein n=1 Tax=Cupriavidus neocaledonicus TaxID=1040979 RepID=A0A375HT88_9BURK|nr:protein of unknown function [Cupriavidus neocaledonicus]